MAYAGIYALSDELGGFKLLSAAGTGSRSDPVSVDVELESASPVTLTIRSLVPAAATPGDLVQSSYFRVSALNNSALAWIEFEFDPLEAVRFSLLVTDFMPKKVFYLVLDPRIPSSRAGLKFPARPQSSGRRRANPR